MASDSKTKKIERDFPLTNSMVNEYGFRLLTSGYMMEEFLKNPIGYRMHNREDGVICRWEDLMIDGDTVYGKPVINLANPKGEQTVDEVENGFLSHASVGQIVLIEYVVEPHPDRPDESIVTGTKWYHKEASLVDAPGNRGLLPVLCDADDKEIKLSDLTSNFKNQNTTMKQVILSITPALIGALGLADGATPDATAVVGAISDLSAKVQDQTLEIANLKRERDEAQAKVKNLQDASGEAGISAMLAEAKLAGKVNDKTVEKLKKQYEGRPEELKELLADMQPFGSVLPHLQGGDGKVPKEFEGKTWDDLHKSNKIKDLKDKAPDLYKQLYKAKYGVEPKM